MRSVEEISSRYKSGITPTADELDAIASALKQGDGDAYALIDLLGECADSRYSSVVEPFLFQTDDPMVVSQALETLCLQWGNAEQYLDIVKEFLSGRPWDDDDDCRLKAASVAAAYLRCHADSDLLAALIDIFEDSEQRQILRESAYRALANAMGRDWKSIPPASRHFDLVKDIDLSVIQEAKARLTRES